MLNLLKDLEAKGVIGHIEYILSEQVLLQPFDVMLMLIIEASRVFRKTAVPNSPQMGAINRKMAAWMIPYL